MSETCPHCGKSVIAGSYRTCPECLEYLDGEAKPKRVPDGHIASVCPNCGKAAHHKVKPTRWVAFAYDKAKIVTVTYFEC
jgi:NMD protein affecting ribosome stability and mRNA decay